MKLKVKKCSDFELSLGKCAIRVKSFELFGHNFEEPSLVYRIPKMNDFTSKDFDEYVDDMIGDFSDELKKKIFNDKRKTSYLEAIKYNADIIWNELQYQAR